MMRPHVSQLPAGVLAVVAEGREMLGDAPRAQHLARAAVRRRPQPHVPVGAGGRPRLLQVAGRRRAADADLDRLQLADPAVADVLGGLLELAAELAALLAA